MPKTNSKTKKSTPASAKPKTGAKKHTLTPGTRELSDIEKLTAIDEKRAAALQKAVKGPMGKYVKLLLDLRDRLLDDIEFHASDNLKRTQKDASSDLSAYSFHMADAGTDNFDREFALSMVSNEQEALYEINEAFKRVENGTFGLCEMSGKPIPKARLWAIPWARYTVECQAEFEKTQQKRHPQTFQLSDFGNSEEEGSERDEEV